VHQAQKDTLAKAKAEQDLKITLDKQIILERDHEAAKKQLLLQHEVLEEAEEEARSLRIQMKRLREDLIREEEKTNKLVEQYGDIDELKEMHEKSIQEWGKKWNYATDQALQSQSREHQFIEQIDRLQRELVLIEKTKRDMEEGFRWRLNESLVERMQELRRSSEAEAQRDERRIEGLV
jgi:hypothetical protein